MHTDKAHNFTALSQAFRWTAPSSVAARSSATRSVASRGKDFRDLKLVAN